MYFFFTALIKISPLFKMQMNIGLIWQHRSSETEYNNIHIKPSDTLVRLNIYIYLFRSVSKIANHFQILNLLLEMRADDMCRLGFLNKAKSLSINYSPYVLCCYRSVIMYIINISYLQRHSCGPFPPPQTNGLM